LRKEMATHPSQIFSPKKDEAQPQAATVCELNCMLHSEAAYTDLAAGTLPSLGPRQGFGFEIPAAPAGARVADGVAGAAGRPRQARGGHGHSLALEFTTCVLSLQPTPSPPSLPRSLPPFLPLSRRSHFEELPTARSRQLAQALVAGFWTASPPRRGSARPRYEARRPRVAATRAASPTATSRALHRRTSLWQSSCAAPAVRGCAYRRLGQHIRPIRTPLVAA
jgi:hypothetical protein